MSTTDTMMPLVSAPWLDAAGSPLPVAPVPGLRSEVIHGLIPTFPGIISPELQELLGFCGGLSGTELGSIDFTGCLFPQEPLSVFRPCLTLGIDDEGRRWIAETSSGRGLPGPVWCVFPDPPVAVYVSVDLAAFIETLRTSAKAGPTLAWLQGLIAQAHVVWSHRQALALRSYDACSSDAAIRAWLSSLPFDAHVYDLRTCTPARGWPYGLAGPSGRLYRCARLPVFAVAGWPAGSRWAPYPIGSDPNDLLRRPEAGTKIPRHDQNSYAAAVPSRNQGSAKIARVEILDTVTGLASSQSQEVTVMRIKRNIEISPPAGGGLWALWVSVALALCFAPEVASEGLVRALSTAEVPAVLLTIGLLSAAAERKK